MQIVINTNSGPPIFEQIIHQIKQAVQNGRLLAGAALPSIRQLANDLNLNHNTVAKAYRILERDAVIETRGYRGTFIHPDAAANSAVDLKAWAAQQLGDAIKQIRAAGVTDSEIRIAFGKVMQGKL